MKLNLDDIEKLDKEKDREKLSLNFYNLGMKYQESANILIKANHIKLFDVIITNLAFSCELFLKSMLYYKEISFKNGHGLRNLFYMLPLSIQDEIKAEMQAPYKGMEFETCLEEQNNAFVSYRYCCEQGSRTANIGFILEFSVSLALVTKKMLNV